MLMHSVVASRSMSRSVSGSRSPSSSVSAHQRHHQKRKREYRDHSREKIRPGRERSPHHRRSSSGHRRSAIAVINSGKSLSRHGKSSRHTKSDLSSSSHHRRHGASADGNGVTECATVRSGSHRRHKNPKSVSSAASQSSSSKRRRYEDDEAAMPRAYRRRSRSRSASIDSAASSYESNDDSAEGNHDLYVSDKRKLKLQRSRDTERLSKSALSAVRETVSSRTTASAERVLPYEMETSNNDAGENMHDSTGLTHVGSLTPRSIVAGATTPVISVAVADRINTPPQTPSQNILKKKVTLPRKEPTPEMDPFEVRRRELIREKEIAAEVSKRLADLLPQKVEEELELRREKMRQDIRLEMEELAQKETGLLKKENESLKEEMKMRLSEAQKELDDLREQFKALQEQTDECMHKVAEDRLRLLEERRKLDEERQVLDREKAERTKAEQQLILNKTGKARPKLAFSFK